MKLQNILIDKIGTLKFSDIGNHKTPVNSVDIGKILYNQNIISVTDLHGRTAFMPPEMLNFYYENAENRDEKTITEWKPCSDIHTLGCIYFIYLSSGKHPFGDDPTYIEYNIIMDKKVNLEVLKDNIFIDIITQMISLDIEKRPKISQVLEEINNCAILEDL